MTVFWDSVWECFLHSPLQHHSGPSNHSGRICTDLCSETVWAVCPRWPPHSVRAKRLGEILGWTNSLLQSWTSSCGWPVATIHRLRRSAAFRPLLNRLILNTVNMKWPNDAAEAKRCVFYYPCLKPSTYLSSHLHLSGERGAFSRVLSAHRWFSFS